MNRDNPLTRFVRRLSLRSPLTDGEREALLELPGSPSRVRSRRTIIRMGEATELATLVVDGLVMRSDQFSSGLRQFTSVYLPGDMCDLHSTVVPVPSWSIEAVTDVTIFSVPHLALINIAAAYPRIARAFWRDTAVDAAIMAKWLAINARLDAKARMAHMLCEMGIRCELAGLGRRSEYPWPASQTDLAEILGITPIHANRTLQALRRTGMIEVQRSAVTIWDWKGLAELAQFDPIYLQAGS